MRPAKLVPDAVASFVAAHPDWSFVGSALRREVKLEGFSAPLALAVRVGMLAEKHDHHPDLELGWGRLAVSWTTHDAGGVTELDLRLAELTDQLTPREGSS